MARVGDFLDEDVGFLDAEAAGGRNLGFWSRVETRA